MTPVERVVMGRAVGREGEEVAVGTAEEMVVVVMEEALVVATRRW